MARKKNSEEAKTIEVPSPRDLFKGIRRQLTEWGVNKLDLVFRVIPGKEREEDFSKELEEVRKECGFLRNSAEFVYALPQDQAEKLLAEKGEVSQIEAYDRTKLIETPNPGFYQFYEGESMVAVFRPRD